MGAYVLQPEGFSGRPVYKHQLRSDYLWHAASSGKWCVGTCVGSVQQIGLYVVDAAAEQKRLRENAGLGDAPTKGRTTKVIRKPKGWLEGVLEGVL